MLNDLNPQNMDCGGLFKNIILKVNFYTSSITIVD